MAWAFCLLAFAGSHIQWTRFGANEQSKHKGVCGGVVWVGVGWVAVGRCGGVGWLIKRKAARSHKIKN